MTAAAAPGTVRARAGIIGLAVAVALGGFLMFWRLTAQSLYLDEAFSLDVATQTPSQLLQTLAAHDAHPPLFYLYAHAALGMLHWPSTWYRYLTAPFGFVTIWATWWLARRSFGDVAAALAALVVATEPTLLLYDRLFRMYAPFIALTALSVVVLYWAKDAGTGRKAIMRWVAYAAIAVVLPYTMYLGVVVVCCECAYALFDLRGRWPVVIAGVVAAAALLPWRWAIAEQMPIAGLAGGRDIAAPLELARVVLGFAMPVDWYLSGPTFDAIFTSAAIAVLAAGMWLARGGVVAIYAAPIVLQVIATFALHRNLAYGRYMLYLIPGFAIAVGGVASALLRSRARVAGVVLAIAVLAVNGVSVTDELVDRFYELSDWDLVAQIVSQHERTSDLFVLDQGYSYLVLRSSSVLSGHDMRGPERPSELPPILRWLDAKPRQRVWYIQNQPEYPDPTHAIDRHLQASRPRLREWLEPRADSSNAVLVELFGPLHRAPPKRAPR